MKTINIFQQAITVSISATIIFVPFNTNALTIEEIPNPRQNNGAWVTDMANILSWETEKKLNRLITNLEQVDGIEIAVVTVPKTSTIESPKAFTTNLFNYWGIGKVQSDNGILFLIFTGNNRVQIETGHGIKSILPNAQVAKIIEHKIIPQYKQGDFDLGTLEGTHALIKSLNPAAVNKVNIDRPKANNGWNRYIYLLLSGIGLIVIRRVICWHRQRCNRVFVQPGKNISLQRTDNRVVHCAKCHKPMKRTKNIELTKAQQVAKKLGGVSYRGYRCLQCSKDEKYYSIAAYFSDSSRYENCPKCQELTVISIGETIEATIDNNLSKYLITKKCHCCDYKTEKITTTPPLSQNRTRNNSSNRSNQDYANYINYGEGNYGSDSGGSFDSDFGGGSSDGDGSGEDW